MKPINSARILGAGAVLLAEKDYLERDVLLIFSVIFGKREQERYSAYGTREGRGEAFSVVFPLQRGWTKGLVLSFLAI